jgi:hypothetical protein
MRYIIFLFLVLLSCSVYDPIVPEINWTDVQYTSWEYTEQINIKQNIRHLFRFGKDTVYLTRVYYNPNSQPNDVPWIRYVKGPVYNKHTEVPPGPPPDNTNLVFTWSRKEYADSTYHTPVINNSIVDDWFLWKINSNGNLLMGYVDLNRNCFYWELTKIN